MAVGSPVSGWGPAYSISGVCPWWTLVTGEFPSRVSRIFSVSASRPRTCAAPPPAAQDSLTTSSVWHGP